MHRIQKATLNLAGCIVAVSSLSGQSAANTPGALCLKSLGVDLSASAARETIEACTSALSGNPSSANVLHAMARAHFALGNLERTFEWSKKAADLGHVAAQAYVGIAYRYGHGVLQDASLAAVWLKRAAEKGDHRAMSNLADLYWTGQGVELNYPKAVQLYGSAAEGGNNHSRILLGLILLNGQHVSADHKKAIDLFNAAASEMYAPALLHLGRVYLLGLGVSKDPAKAFQYFTKASELNLPSAHTQVGLMYQEGIGTPPDPEKAFQFFRRAAEANDLAGMFQYGVRLLNDTGSRRNAPLGTSMITAAAEKGNLDALCYLGSLHEGGRIAGGSLAKGIELYVQGSKAGNVHCQHRLGYKYLQGHGVPKDAVRARALFDAAAKAGHKDSAEVLSRIDASNRENKRRAEEQSRTRQTTLSDVFNAWSDAVEGFGQAASSGKGSNVVVVCNRGSRDYMVSTVHRSGVNSLLDRWTAGAGLLSVPSNSCRPLFTGSEGLQIDAYLNVQEKGLFGGYNDVDFNKRNFSFRSTSGKVRSSNIYVCIPSIKYKLSEPRYNGRRDSLNALGQCPDGGSNFERRLFSLFVDRRNTSNVEITIE